MGFGVVVAWWRELGAHECGGDLLLLGSARRKRRVNGVFEWWPGLSGAKKKRGEREFCRFVGRFVDCKSSELIGGVFGWRRRVPRADECLGGRRNKVVWVVANSLTA